MAWGAQAAQPCPERAVQQDHCPEQHRAPIRISRDTVRRFMVRPTPFGIGQRRADLSLACVDVVAMWLACALASCRSRTGAHRRVRREGPGVATGAFALVCDDPSPDRTNHAVALAPAIQVKAMEATEQ